MYCEGVPRGVVGTPTRLTRRERELWVTAALVAHGVTERIRPYENVVLSAMPAQNQMDDVAQARFDRAIRDSPYLRGRLQPEPPARKWADSNRLGRVGPGYLRTVGGRVSPVCRAADEAPLGLVQRQIRGNPYEWALF